jgi:leucyl aminopeptidase (aminopeptidase T)
MLARRLGFRAATMPGFSAAMVPALRLDYCEVNRRVQLLAALLDRATAAEMLFSVDGGAEHSLRLDLRHRRAHASGGLLHDPGTAGNLPSGESYIVPYEGERSDDPTTSHGELPVEMEDEVVLHRVADNRAVEILSDGPVSRHRRAELAAEPAAANLAELGLGVLGDFGIEPIGEVLLDEKLGLHVAFGRSDHFGGQVGPADFSAPEAVIHQDWVYLPQIQPRVTPLEVRLVMDVGPDELLIRDGKWVVSFT